MSLRFFQSKEWRLLWPHYINKFVFGASLFALPFFVIFFQQKGFTLSQIALFFVAMELGVILFEIPTGIIADIFGRKFSALSGYLITNLIWISIPFIDTFQSLLVSFFLFGVAGTLISGAYEAWIYDWLKHNKAKELVKKYYTTSNSIMAAGAVVGPLIGGLLVVFLPLYWLFVISGGVRLLLSLFMGIFQGEHFVKHEETEKKIKLMLRTGWEGLMFFKNIPYTLLEVSGLSLIIIYSASQIAEQPYLINLGMPIPLLGVFFSFVAFLYIFAPILGYRLSKKRDDINVYLYLTLLSFLMVLSLFFIQPPLWVLGALVLAFATFFDQSMAPIFDTKIQHMLPSKLRATIRSITSMIGSIVSLIVLYVVGIISDSFTPRHAFLLAIVALIIFVPAVLLYKRLTKKTMPNERV